MLLWTILAVSFLQKSYFACNDSNGNFRLVNRKSAKRHNRKCQRSVYLLNRITLYNHNINIVTAFLNE